MLCQPSMAFHEITTRRDNANSRPNTSHLYYVCEKRLEHKVADDFSGSAIDTISSRSTRSEIISAL